MRSYVWGDGAFAYEGCVSVQLEAEWSAPWRIDCDRPALFPFLNAANPPYYETPAGAQCTGVRLTFATDARMIGLALDRPNAGMRLDLLIDGKLEQEKQVLPGESNVMFANLPEGNKQVEIWLDPQYAFRLKSVAVEEGRMLTRVENIRPRWIHYGSSISHVPLGVRPSAIWPAVAAHSQGLHLTNLGFRGNCQLDPMIAHVIADASPDLITLKPGINVHAGSLSERAFGPAVIGFVRTIRERLPETPIAIISPLCSPERESEPGPSGLTLRGMRDTLAATVEVLRAYGDQQIRYIDGLTILGESDAALLPDGLHPSPEAQPLIAARFGREVLAAWIELAE